MPRSSRERSRKPAERVSSSVCSTRHSMGRWRDAAPLRKYSESHTRKASLSTSSSNKHQKWRRPGLELARHRSCLSERPLFSRSLRPEGHRVATSWRLTRARTAVGTFRSGLSGSSAPKDTGRLSRAGRDAGQDPEVVECGEISLLRLCKPTLSAPGHASSNRGQGRTGTGSRPTDRRSERRPCAFRASTPSRQCGGGRPEMAIGCRPLAGGLEAWRARGFPLTPNT